jgi:hypothetical protein
MKPSIRIKADYPAATAIGGQYSLLKKARRWTFDALKDIHTGLPFPLREFHSDNGSEFINQVISDRRRNPACPIPFTPGCADFTIRFSYNTMRTRPSSRCGRPSPLSPLLRGGNRRPKVIFFLNEASGPSVTF